MRTDENGNTCPATLGEYYDLCLAISPKSKAVALLEGMIIRAPGGALEEVATPDSQMRALLVPLLASVGPNG